MTVIPWRRILNNLPYILKTSVQRVQLDHYLDVGVPDYLFNIREFGGVNYSTDSYEDDIMFSMDVYDYRLKFGNGGSYINIPWGNQYKENIGTLELRLNIEMNFLIISHKLLSLVMV